MTYNFDNYKKDAISRPRDIAFKNWGKFEKVGDKVQGYIRDVFYRPSEGQFSEQRGITIEQKDGVLVNVAIKRFDFILASTDGLRVGDPMTMELTELKPNKGKSDTKIFTFFGINLPENKGKTVKELDNEDRATGNNTAEVVDNTELSYDEPAF